MWQLILSGLAIGFAIAAPIGPINLLVIRTALRDGFLKGLASGAGAAFGDGAYAAVAAFGLTAVSDFVQRHARLIEIAGGVVLVALGARTFFRRIGDPAAAASTSGPAGAAYPALTGATFVLTLANPMTMMSFLAVFGGLGGLVGVPRGYADAAVLVAAVTAGSLVWWIGLAALIAQLRTRITARAVALVNGASGAAIVGFGVVVLVRSLWPAAR